MKLALSGPALVFRHSRLDPRGLPSGTSSRSLTNVKLEEPQKVKRVWKDVNDFHSFLDLMPVVEKPEVVNVIQEKLKDLGKPFVVLNTIDVDILSSFPWLSVAVNVMTTDVGLCSTARYKITSKLVLMAVRWRVSCYTVIFQCLPVCLRSDSTIRRQWGSPFDGVESN